MLMKKLVLVSFHNRLWFLYVSIISLCYDSSFSNQSSLSLIKELQWIVDMKEIQRYSLA